MNDTFIATTLRRVREAAAEVERSGTGVEEALRAVRKLRTAAEQAEDELMEHRLSRLR
ncbi:MULTISPECIES: hypothetical protein [Nonomuraea]|jgi:hypothetical protein|uniref:Uncharacterized protein n=1 Tax=Nonomuraea harbinensis TaxID=1286938 RepID=A0ABW1C2Q5_9ACTN|nr:MULTISPECIES: hypothetical protein [Nonomuraea]